MPQIISLVVLGTAIWYMLKVKKQAQSNQVASTLSGGEKTFIWIASLLNPIFSGAVFYYGWKKLLPMKAKQANHISMWAFLIELVLGFVVFFLLAQH
jgi:hypothetical protein